MQAKLQIFTAGGTCVAERALGDDNEAVLVVLADGKPVFRASAGSGDEILAALVRDEDGWSLASPDAGRPVTCGPKTDSDMHLSPGMPYRVGEFVFRIDSGKTESGAVLVWRYARSQPALDVVMDGRNIVAYPEGREIPQVNPAFAGDELFEFYPTPEGLEVVVPGEKAERLTVGARMLFAVGRFEGMLFSAAEAAEAVKSGAPFAWPSRSLRRWLSAAALVVMAVAGLAAYVQVRTGELEARLNGPRGAIQVSATNVHEWERVPSEILVYNLGFYRTLPGVLTAKPNAATLDMIKRGEALSNDVQIARKILFLRRVRAIQEDVQAGRWEELSQGLEGVDERMFTEFDANKFLSDAREIVRLSTVALPAYLMKVSAQGASNDLAAAESRIAATIEGLDDNLFMTADVARAARDDLAGTTEMLKAYVRARDAVLAGLGRTPPALDADSLDRLHDAYAAFENAYLEGNALYDPLRQRERGVLTDIVRRGVGLMLGPGREPGGVAMTLLEPLAQLATLTDTSAEEIASWREKARLAFRETNRRYEKLYADYRTKSGADPAAARKILDEILAIGVPGNYRNWALREKVRLEKPAEADEKEVSK